MKTIDLQKCAKSLIRALFAFTALLEVIEPAENIGGYHTSLEKMEINESNATTANTIINKDNFLKSVSLTITGKTNDEANRDNDLSNDIYLADLSFALAAKPAKNNGDELVLVIMEEEEDSTPVAIVRIAGKPQPGEITPELENGVYTVPGLKLQEGTQDLIFYMQGVVYL